MTVKIIGVTHANIDQTEWNYNGTYPTAFGSGNDFQYETQLRPQYASAHFKFDILVDSEHYIYVAIGQGGTTLGETDYGYLWFWNMTNHAPSGYGVPIYIVATTRRSHLPSSEWDYENRGGGIGPEYSETQILSGSNAWWWHGGWDKPYINPTTADPTATWIPMNCIYSKIYADQYWDHQSVEFRLDGNNNDPQDLAPSVTADDHDQMVERLLVYGYRCIGELLEITTDSEGKKHGWIYVAGAVIWNSGSSVNFAHHDVYFDDGTSLHYCSSTMDNDFHIYGYPVEILNIDEIIESDYYPWAIKKDSGWMSCNREGAYLKIKDTNEWRDCKNSEQVGYDNTVHQLLDNTWERAPKIGLEV